MGFVLWLKLVCCAYLLTLSKYFPWGWTLDLGVKSETSLHRSECRRVMKLEVQPLESVFRVDGFNVRGKALEYRYSNRYWMCASRYSRWVIIHANGLLIY